MRLYILNYTRKIIFILLFSISFACSTHKQITEKDVTNSNHQPLINYQKLNNKLIKKFFRSETDKHKLGQIRFIDYFPSGRIKKETTYKNKNGKLIFYYESGYNYADNNSLIYKYDYSEIPSYKYPQLIESKYFHPSENLTIITQTIDNQIDSTFINTDKNTLGKIIKSSEISKRTYRGRNRLMKSNITNYFYDKSNRVVKEIIIDKKHRDTLQITYTYSNNKSVNYLYKNGDYINEKKYINGLLNTEEESNGNGEKTINNYSYNSQGREILKQKNENGNLVYSYKSYYDKKGLINRYEMINEKDGKSGIWLYEYDKNRRLKYKINLYARE